MAVQGEKERGVMIWQYNEEKERGVMICSTTKREKSYEMAVKGERESKH